MSVFLRWGILGILSVAGLLYAYNASKRMAEARAERISSGSVAGAPAATEIPVTDEGEAAAPSMTDACENELLVARRALEMRGQAAPLDRLLRMPEIAWQEPPERRQRLEKVAIRWFNHEGGIGADALRAAVVSECEESTAAP